MTKRILNLKLIIIKEEINYIEQALDSLKRVECYFDDTEVPKALEILTKAKKVRLKRLHLLETRYNQLDPKVLGEEEN